MVDQSPGLREKAVAEYEASDLKQQDIERTKIAASWIKKFLETLGIEANVESDLFEIDSIRFYGYEESDFPRSYSVAASYRCTTCGERMVEQVVVCDWIKFSPASFGQWLKNPHPCEFVVDKTDRKKIGF